ncbi:hypothetical protein EDD85DRAFT_829234 [Armillaria nabsnona]|nr:hypothetical protein EDD85DRAFT_829234 [Armillaria nabsnona]
MPSTSRNAEPSVQSPRRSPLKNMAKKMKRGVQRVRRWGSSHVILPSPSMSTPSKPNIVTLPSTSTLPDADSLHSLTYSNAKVYGSSDSLGRLNVGTIGRASHHSYDTTSSSSSSGMSSDVLQSRTTAGESMGQHDVPAAPLIEEVSVDVTVDEYDEQKKERKQEDVETVAEETQSGEDLKTADEAGSSSALFTSVYNHPDVPDPFLIDDDDEKSSNNDGSPQLSTSRQSMTPAEEIPLAASLASPLLNINKDVPPPPPSQVDTDPDEDEAPDLYLPGLVLPTMFLPIPNTDPLTTLLTKYIYPPDKRPFRDSTGEWQHTNFHTLVMTNSWRALARMARDRLVTSDPEDLASILGLWYLRLACLARLRLFNQTSAECTNLFSVLNGIAPPSAREWVFERILPFELEVMHARLKYWAGDHIGYLDLLCSLLSKCRTKSRTSKNDPTSVAMWQERGARLALIMASQLMEMNDFGAATKLLEPLCNQNASASSALRSTIARIYLQAGQIDMATMHFSIVAADSSVDPSAKDLNAALLASANGQWERASEVLRRILEKDAENYAVVNNLAVTLLGQGKLKEGIAVLEKALKTSPSSVVVAEPFLFNLSTLYELRSATGADKKRDLLIEVAQWSGDGLRTTCLKLPTN